MPKVGAGSVSSIPPLAPKLKTPMASKSTAPRFAAPPAGVVTPAVPKPMGASVPMGPSSMPPPEPGGGDRPPSTAQPQTKLNALKQINGLRAQLRAGAPALKAVDPPKAPAPKAPKAETLNSLSSPKEPTASPTLGKVLPAAPPKGSAGRGKVTPPRNAASDGTTRGTT